MFSRWKLIQEYTIGKYIGSFEQLMQAIVLHSKI